MSVPSENDDIDAADDRTLRLSAPRVTPERLDRLIRFQRKLAAAAQRTWPLDAEALARLHGEALKDSGLSAREAHALEALARAYCGRRWTLRALEQRLAEAKERIARAGREGRVPSARDLQAVQKVPEEIRQRSALGRLERRYGEAAIGLLHARECELLELHEAVGRLVLKKALFQP